MTLRCPSCPNTRRAGQYACPSCWGRLSVTTRRRLSIRDSRAFARLRQLHGAIAARTPLPLIEVSP
jgi:hypothetical protein